MPHPDTPTDYPDDYFAPDVLKILRAEPMLVVGELPDRDEEEPTSEESKAKAVNASPAGQKLAEELQVDLSALTGTGHKGMITKADVEKAAQ